MSHSPSLDDNQQALRVELYKGLRAEAEKYLEKIPGLWLQKFFLIGAMLAFLLTQEDKLKSASAGLPSDALYDLALYAVAAIAGLIDAKIVEYSLQARIISRFISERFSEMPLLGDWEQRLWGEAGPSEDLRLVRLRSLTTVIVTTVPTILVILLVGGAIGARRGTWIFPALAAFSSLAYLAITYLLWRLVWSKEASRE